MALPIEEIVRRVSSIPGKRFVRFSGDFIGINTRCEMVCDTCGCEWVATATSLYSSKTNCPQCSRYNQTIGIEEAIRRFKSINGYVFVGIKGEYNGKKTIGIMRCPRHGEWEVNADVATRGHGCRMCAAEKGGDRLRMPQDEAERRMTDGRSISIIEFVGGEYRSQKTRVRMICNECGYEWTTSAASLIYIKSGCPSCSRHGFNASKSGYIYALLSECGRFCKVGISNSVESRVKILSRKTPFPFHVHAVREFERGSYAKEAEFDIHNKNQSAGLVGFDGATEWLIYNDKLKESIGRWFNIGG